ncbi:hypothetical protein OUZ56_000711 [Daphnia magna]|uniref:Uncharacterized protein n=1 Tax=Daphnia magna TaxID=35525 RepID=A0ABR0A0I4_9CRUS|nr:hypothetical protein OUZ56_000711 [Daphnia magna]
MKRKVVQHRETWVCNGTEKERNKTEEIAVQQQRRRFSFFFSVATLSTEGGKDRNQLGGPTSVRQQQK